MNSSNVVLLDLRDAPGDTPPDLAGGVLVLDSADSLVKHAETYMSLMAEAAVSAVVCVAIGESSTRNPFDGVVLAVPMALRHATVLWVGDPHGVDWAPNSSSPTPAAGDHGDAVDDLVAALRIPGVFDEVVAMAGQLSGSGLAVNPGIRAVPIAPNPGELTDARAATVRLLSAVDHTPARNLSAPVRQLDATHDLHGTVISGPTADAGREAARRLQTVAGLARTLGTVRALLGPNRPTERLGEAVVAAEQAAENYRRYLAELLNRMDGHLLHDGHTPIDKVLELGVANPREARVHEIAAGLRNVVDARLDQGGSLAVVASEMDHAAASAGPQGCMSALEQLNRAGPLTLPVPAFRAWPIRLFSLPLVAVTCALLAVLLGPDGGGWTGAGALAAGWFSAGWLLLARRPGGQREIGFPATFVPAFLVYGCTAVLGVAAGIAATEPVREWLDPPWLTRQLAAVGVVVLSVAVVMLSWYRAARRWRRALPVTALLDTVAALGRLAEETTVREWLPMRRHRAIAAAAEEVAAALKELASALPDTGNRLFIAPSFGTVADDPTLTGHHPPSQELADVVHGDLLELCRGALDPAWRAAEAGQRSAPGVYARRLDQMLGEYGARVQRNGLTASSPLGRDDARRTALLARLWSESPAALAALRTDDDQPVTQLCRGGQLRYLSTASETGLLRFAPQALRPVLERDSAHHRLAADPGISWSEDGELVGALRLVPLRPESVRIVLGGDP